MLDEQWVPMPGYPNYEVSNYGRIANVRTGRDLTPYPDKRTGAMRVALYREGVRKDVQLNRVVAECYFLKYYEGADVSHRNGDKSDCSVLNLTLGVVDHIERAAYQLAELPVGATISFIDMTEKQIVQVILKAQKIRKRRGID